MRRVLAVVGLAFVLVSTSAAAGPKILLEITGNIDRFKQLTGQQSGRAPGLPRLGPGSSGTSRSTPTRAGCA
jgi:hypothetical protein